MILASSLSAQKSAKAVLGYPAELSNPEDKKLFYTVSNPAARSRTYAWLVISDRDNNPLFDSPSGRPFTAISFGQSFFVLEEQAEWIKIARPYVNGLKIDSMGTVVQGWIPKSNMLLWSTGLVDQVSRIHRKVVLLNRADDINNVVTLADKLQVDLYREPRGGTVHSSIRIHDFYFVYKREADRILIGKSPALTEFDISHNLMGWISESRAVRWDNRICLEPNFEPEAFEERRKNSQFRIKAFGGASFADLFCCKPGDKPDGVFWSDDPVGLPSRYLSSDGKRFKGNVMRMPLLDYRPAETDGLYYFESGVVGTINVKRGKETKFSSKIDEVAGAQLGSKIQEMAVKSTNIDLFFVLEGTEPVYEYKPWLLKAVGDIHQKYAGTKNIRYGILVYRDIPESAVNLNGTIVNRMTEIFPLSADLTAFNSFLDNIDFSNKTDTDDWTSLHYGMYEALMKGGFNEENLNIVFLTGCFGDFRASKFRRDDATASNSAAYFKNTDIIVENLSKLDINLYALQLRNDGLSACRAFTGAAHNYISGAAKIPYNKEYANPDNSEMQVLLDSMRVLHGIEIKEPELEDPHEFSLVTLENGVHPGFLVRPGLYKSMALTDMVDYINKGVTESVTFADGFYALLSRIYSTAGMSVDEAVEDDDLDVTAGRFWPALARFLEDNYERL